MSNRPRITVDGNEAVASVAHRTNEVIAIYPITPSSTMGELADAWSAAGRKNIFGVIPRVMEMQSEAGAAGAVHGAVQAGVLSTTFTASQGLLLMIPNMYKLAGELTPFCMHVAARTLATHALSIFGDHSDVMAVRQTGFTLLASTSLQEAHDMALIGQALTLESRVPVLHFFDGFRTSHEVGCIEQLSDEDLRSLLNFECIDAHRRHGLSPDHPVLRGAAQNPDTFFQMMEARNTAHAAVPRIAADIFERFAALSGRRYHAFEYVGHPSAEHVVVCMGSGAETVSETVLALVATGAKVGCVRVRVFRPFDASAFRSALPTSVRRIAVLDRCKEPNAQSEPLCMDVIAAMAGHMPAVEVSGGRYGLSSKEFTPAMVRAIFDNLASAAPRARFTVGILDDVTHLSLPVDESFDIESPEVKRALFFGLGSDGTVGANKNSIKIITEHTAQYAQGYFVYDSKKAGAVTVSHLRFSPRPIRAPWLVREASFIAVHHFPLLHQQDILQHAAKGATLLINAPLPKHALWEHLPERVQEEIIKKNLRLFVIDGSQVALAAGMKRRINTVMQTCFFAISGVLPREDALAAIKAAIKKSYQSKGDAVVQANCLAVDKTLEQLHEIDTAHLAIGGTSPEPSIPAAAPEFVRQVTAMMLAGKGDLLPVSAFPVDGTWPTGTCRFEKRNLALEIPVWDPALCIQCNKCTLVCPHAAIRAKLATPSALNNAPAEMKHMPWRGREFGTGLEYMLQVAPEDCTGCTLCVRVCPGKARDGSERTSLAMQPQAPLRASEAKNWEFFLSLPETERKDVRATPKLSQFGQPLLEFSGACSGCGETPYLKVLTQLFGERMVIANATGCSSIYGGNLPTTPWCTNASGQGPAWANSLFEDNAEFGLGLRLGLDQQAANARRLLEELAPTLSPSVVRALQGLPPRETEGLAARRNAVQELKAQLRQSSDARAQQLAELADHFVPRSLWIVGGDGWAYDIGFGGLDHVLAGRDNVNILVMDTEVYSNTGGQQSKATQLGAAARFAVSGKASGKKDLGLMAMAHGHAYVASIALGAKDTQALRAIQEAESFDGPSLIIAYSPCIEHGYDMGEALEQQRLAVATGYWPLYRYDPRLLATGQPALQLDSSAPSLPLLALLEKENRFKSILVRDPERGRALAAQAESELRRRRALYEKLAELVVPDGDTPPPSAVPTHAVHS
jgi:pyruvate-ferredoxin/flavodoxin oxidoreductase